MRTTLYICIVCFNPIPLNYCHLCGLKYAKTALLLLPIDSYWSIKRPALIYFPYAQQDDELNETGISWTS